MNIDNQQPQPTEQELEVALENLRATKRAEKEATDRRNAELDKQRAEHKQKSFHANILKAIAGTGIQPANGLTEEALLTALDKSFPADVRIDGTFEALDEHGKPVEFEDAYREWASKRRMWFSADSLRPLTSLAKSEMTVAQKKLFISRFGIEAWTALSSVPKPPTPSVADMKADDYLRLKSSEKAILIQTHGLSTIEAILRRR